MYELIVFGALIFLGVAFQSLRMLLQNQVSFDRKTFLKITVCFVLPVLTILEWLSGTSNQYLALGMLSGIMFALTFAILFNSEIIQKIDEQILIHINTIFIIWMILRYNITPAVIIISFVLILLSIYLAFTKKTFSNVQKILLYMVFTAINLIIVFDQFNKLTDILPDSALTFNAMMLALITGAVLLIAMSYFVTCLLMMTQFNPMFRKIIEVKFGDRQITILRSAVIIIIQAGAFIINYYLNIISMETLLSISLFSITLVSYKSLSEKGQSN